MKTHYRAEKQGDGWLLVADGEPSIPATFINNVLTLDLPEGVSPEESLLVTFPQPVNLISFTIKIGEP